MGLRDILIGTISSADITRDERMEETSTNHSINDVRRKFNQRKNGRFVLPRDFLNNLFNEEQEKVREALDQIYAVDPRAYLRTMLEIAKILVPKDSNIRVDHVNHDIDELMAMSKMNDRPMIPERSGVTESIEDIPWEDATPLHPDITDTPGSLGLRRD